MKIAKKKWILGSIMAVLCMTTIAFVGCSKGDDPIDNGKEEGGGYQQKTKQDIEREYIQKILDHVWVAEDYQGVVRDTLDFYREGNTATFHNRNVTYGWSSDDRPYFISTRDAVYMYVWWFSSSMPVYVEITIYLEGEYTNSHGIVSRMQLVFRFSINSEYDPIYKKTTEILYMYPAISYPFMGWSKGWKLLK